MLQIEVHTTHKTHTFRMHLVCKRMIFNCKNCMFVVGQCFLVNISIRQSSFGNLPDSLAKPLDHGSDFHSLDAHAWSDAKTTVRYLFELASKGFFEGPDRRKMSSGRFSFREHPHDVLPGKLPGGRNFGRLPAT